MASCPSGGSRAPLSAERGKMERGAKSYRCGAGEINTVVDGGRAPGWPLSRMSALESAGMLSHPVTSDSL